MKKLKIRIEKNLKQNRLSFMTRIISGNKNYILLILVLFTLVLFGCEKSQEKQSAEKAGSSSVFQVILAENPVPLSAVTIIAHEKNFFKRNGLEADVKQFTSGKLSLDAVLGGGADFGTVAETPLMHAGFSGQRVYVIATIAYSNNDCKVIARKDRGIASPSDLKGKKVATFIGTSAEFFMNAFLKSHGLSSSDVKVTNLKPPDMVTALVQGEIDAYFIWEPHIYNGKNQIGDKAVIFSGKEIYTETFNIAVMEKFAKEKPDVVMKFIRALIEAEKFIAQNREEAISVISDHTGMNRNVLANIWEDFNFEVVLQPSLLDFMQKEAQWAIDSGIAAGTTIPDYRSMILTEPLKEIKPNSVTIK